MIRVQLNDRAHLLLKTLVERYIAEGQPIGSRTLSRHSGLDLSPASIRNIMADLEEVGFIASPHTSSGRVPTPRGYRFFVDTLLTIKPLDSDEISRIEERIAVDSAQRVIASASQLLSGLTRFTGLVSTPRRDPVFRHLEFLQLSEKRVLLIIVTPEGDVQNRVILTDRHYTPAQLVEATNLINQYCAGQTLESVRRRLVEELHALREDMSRLMTAAIDAGSEALARSDDVVISGERNLLGVRDLASDMDRLRELFEVFDRRTALLHLLELGSHAQGVQLFIGNESGISPLDECSVVTAPYEVDGQVVGTVGVIGPTRMAYERVIPIVDITAKLLSSALSQR